MYTYLTSLLGIVKEHFIEITYVYIKLLSVHYYPHSHTKSE